MWSRIEVSEWGRHFLVSCAERSTTRVWHDIPRSASGVPVAATEFVVAWDLRSKGRVDERRPLGHIGWGTVGVLHDQLTVCDQGFDGELSRKETGFGAGEAIQRTPKGCWISSCPNHNSVISDRKEGVSSEAVTLNTPSRRRSGWGSRAGARTGPGL